MEPWILGLVKADGFFEGCICLEIYLYIPYIILIYIYMQHIYIYIYIQHSSNYGMFIATNPNSETPRSWAFFGLQLCFTSLERPWVVFKFWSCADSSKQWWLAWIMWSNLSLEACQARFPKGLSFSLLWVISFCLSVALKNKDAKKAWKRMSSNNNLHSSSLRNRYN